MIEAKLPDGTILEFPDGTSQTVVQRTVKRVLGKMSPTTQQQDIKRQAIVEEVGQPGFLRTGAISTGRGLAKIGRALGLERVSDILIRGNLPQ